MSKCDTCQVEHDIRKSDVPACCAWYLENVVICGDSVENCPVYEPVKEVNEVGYRRVSAFEQIWYVIKYKLFNRKGKR